MKYLLFALLCCQIAAAAPNTINYSSFLTDVNKKPRAISDFVIFRLYDDSVGGTKLWEEDHNVVAPNGFVSVVLGTRTAFPVRQVIGTNNLFLEMQIRGQSPFARQKIANSFFAFSSAYADSSRHAVIADSAKRAGRAYVSDTLGIHAANEYVLQNFLAGFFPDSSKKAHNADSLGKTPAFAFAKKVDKIDSAKIAQRADSLGVFPAAQYLKADAAANVGIGTTPGAKLHVLGKTILNGPTTIDSGLVINSGILDARKAIFKPYFKAGADAGLPDPIDGELIVWFDTFNNKLNLMYRYGSKRYYAPFSAFYNDNP